MKNAPVCKVCGDCNVSHVASFVLLGIIDSRTWKCGNCNSFFRDPLPSESELQAYYSTRCVRHSEKIEQELASSQAKWILSALLEEGVDSKKLSYTEFGAGRGWLLQAVAGEFGSALGYEPDGSSVQWGRDNLHINLQSGFVDIQNVSALHSEMSIHSMSHVLEHLNDPEGVLKRIADLGETFLFLEVPDGACEGQVMKLDVSPSSSMGQHFISFTNQGMQRFLHRSGYEVVKLDHVGDRKYYSKRVMVLELQNFIRNQMDFLVADEFSPKRGVICFFLLTANCFWTMLKVSILELASKFGYRTRSSMPVLRVLAKSSSARDVQSRVPADG